MHQAVLLPFRPAQVVHMRLDDAGLRTPRELSLNRVPPRGCRSESELCAATHRVLLPVPLNPTATHPHRYGSDARTGVQLSPERQPLAAAEVLR